MRKLLGVSLFITITVQAAFSQDNHYEYQRLGARSSILANAGLSRFEDQSAVILNPATLSFAKGSSFTFNTTAIGTNNIKFENGLGQGFDIKYGNLTILPTMAAGVLKPKKNNRDFVLGYGIYHRMQDKLRFSDRQETSTNVINDVESPGNETYIAQYNLGHEVDEVSGILGIGWDISDHVALGVSQAFTYRGEEYSQSFTASAIPAAGSGATVDFVSLYNSFYARYYKILAQTKVGLSASYDKWDIGLTYGLPSFGLFGNGDVMSEINLTNIRPSNQPSTKPRKSYFANGQGKKIKATYKIPMNASLGVSRPFGNVRLYGAVNWYGAAKSYTIMDPGNVAFVQPSTDSNLVYTKNFLRVWTQNRTVINGSLGADWTYRENAHLLFSFHSDGQYFKNDSTQAGKRLTVKTWNNYHISVGTQQTFKSSDWVVGFSYVFGGKKDALQPYSFDDPTEGNFLQGNRQTGTLKASSLQLLISYSFRFGNNK